MLGLAAPARSQDLLFSRQTVLLGGQQVLNVQNEGAVGVLRNNPGLLADAAGNTAETEVAVEYGRIRARSTVTGGPPGQSGVSNLVETFGEFSASFPVLVFGEPAPPGTTLVLAGAQLDGVLSVGANGTADFIANVNCNGGALASVQGELTNTGYNGPPLPITLAPTVACAIPSVGPVTIGLQMRVSALVVTISSAGTAGADFPSFTWLGFAEVRDAAGNLIPLNQVTAVSPTTGIDWSRPFCSGPPCAAGATITVNSPAPRGFLTGDLCTLAAAIIAANTDAPVDGCVAGSGADTILLPGDFTLLLVDPDPGAGSPGRRFGLPSIASDITIEGGAGATIRRASFGVDFSIFEVLAEGRLTLNDFILLTGRGPDGGAIVNLGQLEVNRSWFENNVAVNGSGGAIFGGATVRDSRFNANRASASGGAVWGPTTATESVFTLNVAGDNGGAIACEVAGCVVSVTASTFSSNRAAGGGAIATLGLHANRSDFTGNMATGTASDGGAIRAGSGPPGFATAAIADSLFFGNTAVAGGGGAVAALNLTVAGSTFAGNRAGAAGGALSVAASASTITNSTVSGNVAGAGGGIAAGDGVALRNVTVNGNFAVERGGGLLAGEGVLRNSIVAGNSAPLGPDCVVEAGTLASDGGNLIGDSTDCALAAVNDQVGTAANPLAPRLGGLEDNGGPGAGAAGFLTAILTQALLPDSPARDAGNPAPPGSGGTACEATDQRGVPRPDPPGGRCDSGAFEGIAAATLSIDDVQVTEGDTGTVAAVFRVTLSAPSEQVVTVQFGTADDTAVAGADYEPTAGVLTFAPGETTRLVTVMVAGDTLNEEDETFAVNLGNAVNARVARSQGIGTILNDDPLPSLTIDDVTVAEGVAGAPATFTVTLSPASGRQVTVAFATASQTATAGEDYVAAAGVLAFDPGVTTMPLTVTVRGDTTTEPTETFAVDLLDPTNATLARSRGVGTITDTPSLFALSINDASVAEGNSGTRPAAFTVSLTPAATVPVTVNYATTNGTAEAGSDYVATSGTLTFDAGETARTITVLVNGDTTSEPDETFFVDLSAPTVAALTRARGVGTIRDDDASGPVELRIAEAVRVTDTLGLVPPSQIRIDLPVTVTDTPGAVPPAAINLAVPVVVADVPGAVPPVAISLAVPVAVADVPAARPPALIAVAEALAVVDVPAAVPPAAIAVAEALGVADVPAAVPPALIAVAEGLGVTDVPAAVPPAAIAVAEALGVADVPAAVPPALITVAEALAVADAPDAIPPAVITVDEALGLADVPGAHPPAAIEVAEEFGILDTPGAVPPAAISVAESLEVADSPGAATPAAVSASSPRPFR